MMLRLVITVCAMILSLSVSAQQVKPFVKGSFASIQQHYQGQPYLVLFWAEDCAYCMKELANLVPILKANPEITLVTVGTDPFLEDSIVLNKMAEFAPAQSEHWVFASDYPETLYFDVEKRWRGELPMTYLSDGDSLVRRMGLLEASDIQAWLAALN